MDSRGRGVDLSDKNDPNATFKIKDSDVKVKAVFEKKDDDKSRSDKDKTDDDDDDHHDSSGSSDTKSPDGFDELRVLLKNAIASGKVTTVTWNKGASLPVDIMQTLHDNPRVTLVFSCTYQGVPYTFTIPGSAVVLNPEIHWYGPVCLYGLYGSAGAPAPTADTGAAFKIYNVKSGDTLYGIAKKLNTTQKHLKDLNNIKDPDKLKVGMLLKY